jgi:hypothetical protein
MNLNCGSIHNLDIDAHHMPMLFTVGIHEMHLCDDIFHSIPARPCQELLDSRRDQNRCLASVTTLLSGFGGVPSRILHNCELSDASHH